MQSYLREFFLAFFPLLVAIDAIGTLPLVLGIIQDNTFAKRVRVTNIALATALLVGFLFLFLGHLLLRFLGIRVEHFAIAGGLILLALGLQEMLSGRPQDAPSESEMLAVVPIGTPLTAGPATLATLLLLSDRHSPLTVVAPAFIANIAIAWGVFVFGNRIAAVLGKGGIQAVIKIAGLLLTAIAVRLIVDGVVAAVRLAPAA